MITLRRWAFASVIALALFLVLIQYSFRPLNNDSYQSIIDTSHFVEDIFWKQEESSSTTVVGLKTDPTFVSSIRSSPVSLAVSLTSSSSASAVASSAVIPDKIIVVAKLKWEDTNWVHENFPDWQTAIYTTDDPEATLHTSINKGREANVYLTYIIDHYATLPSTIVFLHSHQKHEHGSRDVAEDVDFDNVASVKALKIDSIQQTGYSNLRCIWRPGCPSEIQPFRPQEEWDSLRPQEQAMPEAWRALFGNDSAVPKVIAAPCCAQFAISSKQVRMRGKAEYERFWRWLRDTPLDDATSGRVFEYLWHVIFGREPVDCPNVEQCYRDLYGTTPPLSQVEEVKPSNDTSGK